MDIKYLSDAKGIITGVFIPIDEWERLQKEYKFSAAEPAPANQQLQKSLAKALKNVKLDDSAE